MVCQSSLRGAMDTVPPLPQEIQDIIARYSPESQKKLEAYRCRRCWVHFCDVNHNPCRFCLYCDECIHVEIAETHVKYPGCDPTTKSLCERCNVNFKSVTSGWGCGACMASSWLQFIQQKVERLRKHPLKIYYHIPSYNPFYIPIEEGE